MPIRRQRPLLKEFTLIQSDAAYGDGSETPSRITVRQATQRDHERRAALFANIVREMGQNDDMVRLIQRFSFEELKRIECFLTLADCNIQDENGDKLFQFTNLAPVSEKQFNEAWGSLPPLICNEIHDKVLEVNLDWGPSGE